LDHSALGRKATLVWHAVRPGLAASMLILSMNSVRRQGSAHPGGNAIQTSTALSHPSAVSDNIGHTYTNAPRMKPCNVSFLSHARCCLDSASCAPDRERCAQPLVPQFNLAKACWEKNQRLRYRSIHLHGLTASRELLGGCMCNSSAELLV
jgi:hypothetical protein